MTGASRGSRTNVCIVHNLVSLEQFTRVLPSTPRSLERLPFPCYITSFRKKYSPKYFSLRSPQTSPYFPGDPQNLFQHQNEPAYYSVTCDIQSVHDRGSFYVTIVAWLTSSIMYRTICGPVQLSRYSDWLRAGGSGDRIPVEARFSAPVQTGPGAHPASYTMGTGSFPGVKSGRGVTLTPHPLLVSLVMKKYSYTSTPPVGRTACTEPQCLYKGALYLYNAKTRQAVFHFLLIRVMFFCSQVWNINFRDHRDKKNHYYVELKP